MSIVWLDDKINRMNPNWLNSLDRNTYLLVPTRSLQAELKVRFAQAQVDAGKHVWETPNILTWGDYLADLWRANAAVFPTIISQIDEAQARLIWERVIYDSRRQQDELALLNVQQTARAAQRSWTMAHEWQIDWSCLQNDAVADTQQFAKWCLAYQEELSQRGLLDRVGLYQALLSLIESNTLIHQVGQVYWYGFDLINQAQSHWQAKTQELGIEQTQIPSADTQTQREYVRYANAQDELLDVLQQARDLVEQAPTTRINIVIANLQQQQQSVRSLAASVFYPASEPLELQNNNLAYRFSLGAELLHWPALQAAMKALAALTGSLSVNDLTWLLRNRFFRSCRVLQTEVAALDNLLQKSRIDQISFEALPEFLVQAEFDTQSKLLEWINSLVAFRAQLKERLEQPSNSHRTISFAEWRQVFVDWLALWGWSTAVSSDALSTIDYQLLERWQNFLNEFENLAVIQSSVSVTRALVLLNQQAREQVFQPKAASSPVFISGVYEAIGMQCDVCFIVGMDEQQPSPARLDAFLANPLRESQHYPSATPTRHVEQAKRVFASLESTAKRCVISYAEHDAQDPSIKRACSSIYRDQFSNADLQTKSVSKELSTQIEMQVLDDQIAPATEAGNVKGGTTVFTNQSQCAFRAFVRHRLEAYDHDEVEFGLDHLDRGNIVHKLLELTWEQLQKQSELIAKIDAGELGEFVEQMVAQTIATYADELTPAKQKLLLLETTRLRTLLHDWLEFEAKRPDDFSVIGTEQEGRHTVGGIAFNYSIDRIDVNGHGDTLIIDYKTGVVNRKDLYGERIKQPQMPLYAQAINAQKHTPISGIAFAQVRQHDHQFQELCEAGFIARRASDAEKFAEHWAQASADWPAQLEQLAKDFLNGQAQVNPIENATCDYCDLHALCRINQRAEIAEGDCE